MKNVDTSLGEAPSIAERLRWGGSHGTALYFLLTVSTFPRHRCGGRCSSCRGQRMPLSLRDCRSAHHQNILSCAGMLSCTFPEIQHCSLHKPSKENPIVTFRQFFQFLHKGIRITGATCDDQFFIRLDILEGLNQIPPVLNIGYTPIIFLLTPVRLLLPAPVGTSPTAIFPFQPVLMPIGKLPAAHRADLWPHGLPVLRLRVGVVPP